MRNHCWKIVLLFIVLCSPGYAEERLRIAVLEFRTLGDLPASTGSIVSELLEGALTETGVFTTVVRKDIEKVLKEQALQTSGVCSEAECAVRIGKMLAANKLLVGTVSKLGKRYIVNVRLVDVEKGTAELSEQFSADEIEALEPGARTMSKRIADRAGTRTPVADKPEPTGPIFPDALLWRSAVIPGWGQIHSDHQMKGWGLLAVHIVLGGILATSYSDFNGAKAEWSRAQTMGTIGLGIPQMGIPINLIAESQAKSAHSTMKSTSRSAAFSSILLLGAYGFNLYDAHETRSPVSVMRAELTWTPGKAFAFGFRWSF